MSYAQIRSTVIGAVLAFSLITVSGTHAQQNSPALNPSHPDSYVVQRGDTLWDIAAMFLRDPWYWPEIWQINPQVENPHLIFPGDVLSLAYLDDGRPVIQLSRGNQGPTEAGPTERLSPRIRSQAIEEAIPTIPYDTLRAFLSRPAILDPGTLDELPYLFAQVEGLLGSAGRDVYVRGTDAPVDSVFNIVHTGDALVDPDDGTVIGYQGLYVGQGRIRRTGDPSTLYLTETTREASIGDYLIEEEGITPVNYFPSAPAQQVEGRIISVLDGVSMIGQYQVIVLNRGARDGLQPGHVLSVYQTGELISDTTRKNGFSNEKVRLPDEPAGTTMVFRVFDRMSYALVMEATREIRVLDTVRNPES
jgi:LysM domain